MGDVTRHPCGYHGPQMAPDPGCDRSMRRAYGRSLSIVTVGGPAWPVSVEPATSILQLAGRLSRHRTQHHDAAARTVVVDLLDTSFMTLG